jgi:ATP-binding cassette subfamily B protein
MAYLLGATGTQRSPDLMAANESGVERRALKGLMIYLWSGEPHQKLAAVAGMLITALASTTAVIAPYGLRSLIDGLPQARGGLSPGLIVLLVAYPSAIFLSAALPRMISLITAGLLERTKWRLAVDAFSHLHKLPVSFHQDRSPGSLYPIIDRGIKALEFLQAFIFFSIGHLFVQVTLTCFIVSTVVDPLVASVVMSVVIGFGVLATTITRRQLGYRKSFNEWENAASSVALDSLANYENVKYFAQEQAEVSRYTATKTSSHASAAQNNRASDLLNIAWSALAQAGMGSILFLAALRVANGSTTVGVLVMVNIYIVQLYSSLGALGFFYRDIRQNLLDLGQLQLLLEEAPERPTCSGAQRLTEPQGHLAFRRVSFGYHTDRVVVRDLSFNVPAGCTIGIVGPTGSGKSTIARLLLRTHRVWTGLIEYDDVDIQKVHLADLRSAISIVPQECSLFNETIAYNISYGAKWASFEDVVHASRMAMIDTFIRSLPDGYETRVGERGLKLSGGERQRIAIARAILRRSPVIVFDEATSSLDSNTERAIQANIEEELTGITKIVIAHRLSAVMAADEIIVLDEGAVVERGKHESLLASGGNYARLWALQSHVQPGELTEILR